MPVPVNGGMCLACGLAAVVCMASKIRRRAATMASLSSAGMSYLTRALLRRRRGGRVAIDVAGRHRGLAVVWVPFRTGRAVHAAARMRVARGHVWVGAVGRLLVTVRVSRARSREGGVCRGTIELETAGASATRVAMQYAVQYAMLL